MPVPMMPPTTTMVASKNPSSRFSAMRRRLLGSELLENRADAHNIRAGDPSSLDKGGKKAMKAVVYRRNGPPEVLEYEDIEKPTPADDEVLIKVRAASINPLDWRLMRGLPGPLNLLVTRGRSKVHHPGVDVAGEIEAVGRSVTRF